MTSSRVPTNAVDHVGSLKRPPELEEAWRAWEGGSLPFEKLRQVQDDAIRNAVAMQEKLGLPIVTDGEFRRAGWSRGFLNAVDGFEFRASKLVFRNDEGFSTPSPAPLATKPIKRAKPIVTEDFEFVASVAKHPIKVTMPTPSHMHFGQFKQAVDAAVYPDVEKYCRLLLKLYSTTATSTRSSSNTIPSAPAILRRCRTCQPVNGRILESSARKIRLWRRKMTCFAASMRPAALHRWSGWAFVRSAASPARRCRSSRSNQAR